MTQATIDIWLEPQPDGTRWPSWIQRGHCVITDTTSLKGSGQVFFAGVDGAPIDVQFTDAAGSVHAIEGAGVVEVLFDVHSDRGVEVHVYEPPRVHSTV